MYEYSLLLSMMILFADSGSTKTAWLLYDTAARSRKYFETLGINPIIHHHEEIYQKVFSNTELVSHANEVSEIRFFGAGCSSTERNNLAASALKSIFTNATIEIDHDMKAAAYAICGSEPGIACILGTGSNSIFFDGEHLVDSYAGIGYILGDEASGAYFGKIILRDFLYHLLPEEIEQYLLSDHKLEKNTIFQLVYKEASPNRYLASFAPVLSKFRHTDYAQVVLQRGFTEFFDFHVSCFENYQDYTVGFVGSIANCFRLELEKVANDFECRLGKFVVNPIDDIADYFIKKM